MPYSYYGPASAKFEPLRYTSRMTMEDLAISGLISPQMAQACATAPEIPAVYWGIPYADRGVICLANEPVQIKLQPRQAKWLVFLHTGDLHPLEGSMDRGFISPMPGEGRLNEHLADYIFLFEDGSEERIQIRCRYQIGAYAWRWGELCFQAVPSQKPHPVRAAHEQTALDWGKTQTRVNWGEKTAWGE